MRPPHSRLPWVAVRRCREIAVRPNKRMNQTKRGSVVGGPAPRDIIIKSRFAGYAQCYVGIVR